MVLGVFFICFLFLLDMRRGGTLLHSQRGGSFAKEKMKGGGERSLQVGVRSVPVWLVWYFDSLLSFLFLFEISTVFDTYAWLITWDGQVARVGQNVFFLKSTGLIPPGKHGGPEWLRTLNQMGWVRSNSIESGRSSNGLLLLRAGLYPTSLL